MKNKWVVITFLILILTTGSLFAKSALMVLITDMYNQKNIKPQEQGSMLHFPIDSVTRKGKVYRNVGDTTVLTSWIAREAMPTTTTKNPIKPTKESIADGEYMYHVYCQVCHGNLQKPNKAGLGDSKVNQKGMMAMYLTPMLPALSDGYIFYKATYGSGAIMPPLGNAMTEKERWDLVNYLRHTVR